MAQLQQISTIAPGGSRARGFRLPEAVSGGVIAFLLVVVCLVIYGLVVCNSAVAGKEQYNFSRQLMGVGLGIIAMGIVWSFDYRKLANAYIPLLIVSAVLILSPHIPGIGVNENGANSWIKIGMRFQPGEFAKITVILFAASLVSRYKGSLGDPKEYLKVVLLLLIPFLCIMTQPDLGTGLVYLFISAVVLVMGGAKARYLIISLVVAALGIAALLLLDEFVFKYEEPANASGYEYKILKQYQRSRLTVFLDPEADTSGIGYNLRQAMIAVGSGGLFGKGLGNGTQVNGEFLPEAPTDFIFCVLAEELGFMGALVLLLLYAALLICAIRIALKADNIFGMLIVCAIVGMWLFQILENIGMDIGLMPITGIPLPFFSYGSSFMLTNFVLIGLVCSVSTHHSQLGRGAKYAVTH